jgi:hypothetical protein
MISSLLFTRQLAVEVPFIFKNSSPILRPHFRPISSSAGSASH